MPFALLADDGAILALYPQQGPDRRWIPLHDPRIIPLLVAEDPSAESALLQAGDKLHGLLLTALLEVLEAQRLLPRQQTGLHSLDALLDGVESSEEDALASLASSDANTVRVIEDVVDLLVEGRLIRFTDLPPEAQRLLLMRRELRAYLNDDDDLLNDEASTLPL